MDTLHADAQQFGEIINLPLSALFYALSQKLERRKPSLSISQKCPLKEAQSKTIGLLTLFHHLKLLTGETQCRN